MVLNNWFFSNCIWKKIVIKKIPEVEIQVFPDVEVFHLDQGVLNTYSEKEIQTITKNAKDKILKQAENSSIKTNAKNQLIENMNDLFFIAKIYNWKIVDESGKGFNP